MGIDVHSPEFERAWAKAVAQARCDDEFERAFRADPARVLREEGADIPSNTELSLSEEPLASLWKMSMDAISLAQPAGAGGPTPPSPQATTPGTMATAGTLTPTPTAGTSGSYAPGQCGGGPALVTAGSAGTVGSIGTFCGTAGTIACSGTVGSAGGQSVTGQAPQAQTPEPPRSLVSPEPIAQGSTAGCAGSAGSLGTVCGTAACLFCVGTAGTASPSSAHLGGGSS